MNTQREEEFIEHTSKSEHDVALGIALKSTDRLIGTVGLHGINFKDRKADFGIMIAAKEEWNKGYGTEATKLFLGYGFETLNLNRLNCACMNTMHVRFMCMRKWALNTKVKCAKIIIGRGDIGIRM